MLCFQMGTFRLHLIRWDGDGGREENDRRGLLIGV